MMSRDERKKEKGIKKLFRSFIYPIKGLKYAYRNEQNIFVDVIGIILVVIFGFLLKVSSIEWTILVIVMGLVLSLELINTAIEAMVDLVTEEYHPVAKIVKDTASAAVFVIALAAAITGIIIFLPKIIDILT